MRLRKAKPDDRAGIRIRVLIRKWKEFGVSLGLDAEQERARREEEARIGCSWLECPRREQNIAGDEPVLRKCAGCGEAKYCSRECQSR